MAQPHRTHPALLQHCHKTGRASCSPAPLQRHVFKPVSHVATGTKSISSPAEQGHKQRRVVMLTHKLRCHSTEKSRKWHSSGETSPLTAEPTTQLGLLSTIPRTLLPSGNSGAMAEPDTGCWAHMRVLGEVQGRTSGFRAIPHSSPPGKSLTLVKLGIAQEEGAVEDGQDPTEGQQVKDTDRAQQRPIKPGNKQQDTAVKTKQPTP